jgi:hypothetical protein
LEEGVSFFAGKAFSSINNKKGSRSGLQAVVTPSVQQMPRSGALFFNGYVEEVEVE